MGRSKMGRFDWGRFDYETFWQGDVLTMRRFDLIPASLTAAIAPCIINSIRSPGCDTIIIVPETILFVSIITPIYDVAWLASSHQTVVISKMSKCQQNTPDDDNTYAE